jgi:CHAT domain-containing protein/tetratricopeptide (TPR) repeat protein
MAARRKMKQLTLTNFKGLRSIFISPMSLVALLMLLTMATERAVLSQTTTKESKQTDARELKLGEPIERELAGGAVDSYQVTLTAGQYLKVVVEQKGIDVVVRLFGPDGQKITEVDNPNGTQGPEPVSLIAQVSATYRLEVTSLEKGAAPGRYEIKLEELREATAKDRDRISAERALAEAEQFRAQGTAESLRKAIEKYQQALPLWSTLGDRQKEALTLSMIGQIHWQLGESQKALEYSSQAVSLSRAVGDRKGEAESLHNIGVDYWQLGNSQKALEYYSQSLLPRREVGDLQGEAITLNAIGLANNTLGKLKEAIEYYNQALALQRRLGDRNSEVTTLNNIGVPYYHLGEKQKALEYHNQALSLARELGDHRLEAAALTSIGFIYSKLGENQKALENYNEALPLQRVTGDRSGESNTLHNIGTVYDSLGEIQKALEYYNQALLLLRAVGDRRNQAATLMNIGITYSKLGQPQKALDSLNQALMLRRAVGDRLGEALSLSRIGSTYSLWGKYEEALPYLEQALSLQRELGARSDEAETLQSIARADRERGRLDEARTQIEAALKIIETMRSKFVGQELRTSVSASTQKYYETYIDLLMQLHRKEPLAGHDVTAFVASERARARSLLELLTESRVDIRQGVDQALLERERALQQQLNARSERLTRLLSGKHTEEQETAAKKEVEALLADFQNAEAQIRTQSPRYAALTQPQPLSLKEIQRLLDDETVVLEYALGEERSYLWLVTPDSIRSFELPKSKEIETAARRVYDLLVTKTDALYPEALTSLSRMLLGPAADQLGQKRLLIVGQDALQYVPFGALPEPSPGQASGSKHPSSHPLVLNHEIVTLPSASVLALLRREFTKPATAFQKIAVFADPVFAKDDPRVKARMDVAADKGKEEAKQNGNGRSSRPSDVVRAAGDVNLTSFERLPISRSEADLITTLVPKTKALKALDFAASRATATSPDLGSYQIVHFATHSLLNNEHPELSGIVLSLVDKQGQPQDGFLRLHDIYNLKLGADLVVLSACQTALGKEIKGEGLVGLTRGFMYAGTPRVVASLWKVSDTATAELMKRFYRKMFIDKLRPAAALRAAQVSMSREKQWAAPYHWAGFVLQGEWK